MVEVDEIMEPLEIVKIFKDNYNVNLDIYIAEAMADSITDIVRFYEESDKKTVAYEFVPKLMNLERAIYEKYHDFFYKHDINSFIVGIVLGNRVNFYISAIK